MIWDILIVGGGASGLVAAIYGAKQGNKVILLEHKEKVGKKILATGNGKCNFTNQYQDSSCYHSDSPSFPMKVLSHYGYKETLAFFESLGILPKNKNGYVYPFSGQAGSILEVLSRELAALQVEIVCKEHVFQMEPVRNGFLVKTAEQQYECRNVILSTGGMASKNLGSDGSGYRLAQSIGHHMIEVVPALIGLKTGNRYFKKLAGIRTDGKIKLMIEKQFVAEDTGELQLTSYGVSGIPAFQISRFAAKALKEKKKTEIIIDFLPQMEESFLYEFLMKRRKMEIKKHLALEEMMIGLLNRSLLKVLIERSGLFGNMLISDIKSEDIRKLVKIIKGLIVPIVDTNGFDNAQVSAGGVDTKEVNPLTMESRLVKGCYITGELLDVDGICGGYNLQWAWSSGALAGIHAGKG